MTPAEHRAEAEKNLTALRSHSSGSPTYHGYALSAIAHVLAAIAEYLQPPPEQDIPGLPAGWQVATAQSEKGSQLWKYAVAGPGIETEHSPYRYAESATALTAGLRYAQALTTTTGE